MTLKRLLIGLSILLFLYSLYEVYSLTKSSRQEDVLFHQRGEAVVTAGANRLDSLLQKIEMDLQAMADELSDRQDIKEAGLHEMLRTYADSIPEVVALTICYLPYEYSPDTRLFAPFLDIPKDTIIDVADLYDYSDRSKPSLSDWVYLPIETGEFWKEPGYAEGLAQDVVDVGIPFKKDGRIIGMVDATLSLKAMSDLVKKISFGQEGFAFLITEGGAFIAHPNQSTIKEHQQIDEYAIENEDSSLLSISGKMMNGAIGSDNYFDLLANKPSAIFYHPVKTTDWSLGIILHQELSKEFLANRPYALLRLVVVVLLGILFLITGIFLQAPENILWLPATLISLFLAVATVLLIIIFEQFPSHKELKVIELNDQASLNRFHNLVRITTRERNEKSPIFISTGINLENLRVLNARNVGVSGMIWQSYPKDYPAGLPVGFKFRDVDVDAEAMYIELERQIEKADETIYQWRFRGTISSRSSYEHYPFDFKQISIVLLPAAFGENVYLAPDLENYTFISSGSNLGLKDGLSMVGWKTINTLFTADQKNLSANYGLSDFQFQNDYPLFTFNIELKRIIASPLIGYLIPVIIIVTMLFAVMTTISSKNRELSGYSSFGVITTCAAFFFVSVLQHIDLRKTVDIVSITYLESYFFISYAFLLLVVVNSILFTDSKYFKFVDYKENFYPKLLYWPLFFFIIFTLTLISLF